METLNYIISFRDKETTFLLEKVMDCIKDYEGKYVQEKSNNFVGIIYRFGIYSVQVTHKEGSIIAVVFTSKQKKHEDSIRANIPQQDRHVSIAVS